MSDQNEDDRDTLPPTDDRDAFLRDAHRAFVDGAKELRETREAVGKNLTEALERQTAIISKLIDANYGMVRQEVVALRTELEAVSEREHANTTGLEGLRAEFAELREKFDQLESRMNAAGPPAPPR